MCAAMSMLDLLLLEPKVWYCRYGGSDDDFRCEEEAVGVGSSSRRISGCYESWWSEKTCRVAAVVVIAGVRSS
jgi:hypothetical protein